jgi:hypothetical protein
MSVEQKGSFARRQVVFLKQLLLLFWATWLTLVCATNVTDGARTLGLLGKSWAFASGNYASVVETTKRYHPPEWVNRLLFGGVICWEGTVAVLFWLAWWCYRGQGEESRAPLYVAFTAGLGLWAAFIIADEICITYPIEATHWRLFIAQLATLLAIELLPERDPPAAKG